MSTSPARPVVALIAAVARNRVIGANNALLWHLPEDMAHFRRSTAGCAVIMGRKTWESLPERFRPLPGRRNLVLSRQPGWQAPGAEVFSTLDEALSQVADQRRVFVIGGEQIYALALPMADELWLTEIDQDFAGDAYFPAWDAAAFTERSRLTQAASAPHAFQLSFVTYERVPSTPLTAEV